MPFLPEVNKALDAKLSPDVVKGRTQGGRTVSYIEGWHAIAEANRIFGFGNWNRETVDIKCISEKEREIGKDKVPGWSVTYIVKCRVIVEETIREGCGAGHGIDRDLGQAHESAIKEAETDAMKRALMTFGNPFGLALYDKERINVGFEQSTIMSTNDFMVDYREAIMEFTNGAQLLEWWNSAEQKELRRASGIDQHQVDSLKKLVTDRRLHLVKDKVA
jgi:DNA recombination protein Rad52